MCREFFSRSKLRLSGLAESPHKEPFPRLQPPLKNSLMAKIEIEITWRRSSLCLCRRTPPSGIVRVMLCQETHLRRLARWRILLAICAVALVIFGGVVEVSHSHSLNDISQARCSLCATAHIATQPSAPITAPARVKHVSAMIAEIPFVTVRRLGNFSFRIRPPPVKAATA